MLQGRAYVVDALVTEREGKKCMEIQELVRCSIVRGGTSKGIFLLRNDLPKNERLRDKVIRKNIWSS